jgi:mannose-6-phosphate isomerase class I
MSAEELKKLPFAEFWMGDHPNGPSMVKISEEADIIHELINDQSFID